MVCLTKRIFFAVYPEIINLLAPLQVSISVLDFLCQVFRKFVSQSLSKFPVCHFKNILHTVIQKVCQSLIQKFIQSLSGSHSESLSVSQSDIFYQLFRKLIICGFNRLHYFPSPVWPVLKLVIRQCLGVKGLRVEIVIFFLAK